MSGAPPPETVRRVEPVMGTVVSILAEPAAGYETEVAAAVAEAVGWLREVDRRFTTYRPDSEWLRWCRGGIDFDEAHPDLRHVITRTAALEEETGGAFSLDADPNRPPDPAAYVKGWSIQQVADRLVAAGAQAVCVNGGGDVAVAGRDRPWRIGIQDPHRRDGVLAVVELAHGSVATSGGYERGDHIYDPTTGRPARGVASVTVIGDDLGVADAYATAAFAMGGRAAGWLWSRAEVSAYVVHGDGTTEAIRTRAA